MPKNSKTHLHEVLALLVRHLVVPVRVEPPALHLALLLDALLHLHTYVSVRGWWHVGWIDMMSIPGQSMSR